MQLIVITPEKTLKDEASIAESLFANGLQRLHVRKPLFTAVDYRNYIGAIDSKYHELIAIHGSFELYDELTLGGIHLNGAFRNDKSIWEKLRHLSPSVISTSCHSWDEIKKNEFPYRYVFISPVFDSISKPGYRGAIELKGAMKTKQQLAENNKYCPAIIGLGGVGPCEISVLYEHGFDGAAVLGAIWKSEDPVEKFVEIKNVVSALSNR